MALTIALALAWIIAQRIAGPIAELANATDSGLGRLPRAPRIEEVARLHKALSDRAPFDFHRCMIGRLPIPQKRRFTKR